MAANKAAAQKRRMASELDDAQEWVFTGVAGADCTAASAPRWLPVANNAGLDQPARSRISSCTYHRFTIEQGRLGISHGQIGTGQFYTIAVLFLRVIGLSQPVAIEGNQTIVVTGTL